MALSRSKRHEANLVFTFLGWNVCEKKNIRRLQTLSISHCLLHRLRKCFDCFKLLLDPSFKMSAQDWYRKRLVASVFGRWITFLHDQQLDDDILLDRSITFRKRKSIKDFSIRSRERQICHHNNSRAIHLGFTYYSYLRLLGSFEIICARKDASLLSLSNIDHAQRYLNRRIKFLCIELLVHKVHIAHERHQKFEMGKTHYKSRSLRIFLSSWRKYIAMRKRDIIGSRSISPVPSNLLSNPEHHSASSLCIQHKFCECRTVYDIWRVKMSRQAMVAFRIFTLKKKCFSKRGNISRVRDGSEPGDLSAAVCRNLRSAPDQEKAVAVITMMKVLMRKWTAGIVKRSHRKVALSVGVSHWLSFGRYLQIIRALTLMQTRQKRSFVENRRTSLASLSHNQQLLRTGLKRFTSFARATRLESSCRMSADFKREMKQYTAGLSACVRNAALRSAGREGLVRAVVIWKVTRLVSAVREWSRWVKSKREKRVMLLEARSCYQQSVKESACRLWLTAAAGNIEKNRADSIRKLVGRVAKRWRSLVYRNRLTRLKQDQMRTLASYGSANFTHANMQMQQTQPSSNMLAYTASTHSLHRSQPRALNPSFSPENLARTPLHRACSLLAQSPSSACIMNDKITAWPTRLSTPQSEVLGTSKVQSYTSSPPSHITLPISGVSVEAASNLSYRSGSGSGSGSGGWCGDIRGIASSDHQERDSGSERGNVTATPVHGLGLAHAPPRRQSSAPRSANTPGQGVSAPRGGTETPHGGGNREGLDGKVVQIDNRELLAREIIDFISEMRAAMDSQQ